MKIAVLEADVINERLNEYGELGWELVSCYVVNNEFIATNIRCTVFASFKRKKEN